MARSKNASKILPYYSDWEDFSASEIKNIFNDFVAYCEKAIKITPKGGGKAIPLKLKRAQKLVAKEILKVINPVIMKLEDPYPINILIVKSRQQGITTVICALDIYLMTRIRNIKIGHVFHTREATKEARDKKFISMLHGMHPYFLPDVTAAENRVDFNQYGSSKLNNRITFLTAGSAAGVGETLQVLIEDEYGKYQNPIQFDEGIVPALNSSTGLSIRIIVSTSYGINAFYDKYQSALKAPDKWTTIFIPWFLDPDYEIKPEGKYDIKNNGIPNFTEYELFLMDNFDLYNIPRDRYMAKLSWYMSELKKSGRQEFMYLSYPTTAEEAFMSSGDSVFDNKIILEWKKKKYKSYNIVQDFKTKKPSLVEDNGGLLDVIEEPKNGRSYVIGVDQSDGLKGGDASAFCVMDIANLKVVAQLNANIEQTDLAEYVYHVALMYNNALVVPERNKGALFIDYLMRNFGYGYVYAESANGRREVTPGVYTSAINKQTNINKMAFFLKNGVYQDFGEEFCDQASHFISSRSANGRNVKLGGSAGFHDDAVMARVMAFHIIDPQSYSHMVK